VTQPSLFDQVAVHCFFRCAHVVRDVTPEAAHASMESHYTQSHRRQLDALVASVVPPAKRSYGEVL
jgi:hypothetical protein